jgi:hypothetical protein
VLKGIRCFTLPLVMMAKARERLLADMEECQKRVPEDRQVLSPPEVAGPVLSQLRFLDDTNPLRGMYLNLLTASIDRERQSKAHPAFPFVLNQISRDEAILLRAISLKPDAEIDTVKFATGERVVDHDLPVQDSELAFPDRVYDALFHMSPLGLNLIGMFPMPAQEQGRERMRLELSRWGRRFAEACIISPK